MIEGLVPRGGRGLCFVRIKEYFSGRIFLQIRDNLPIGLGVNATKFEVNWRGLTILQKLLNYREITIFATKVVQFFLQIWDNRPLGVGGQSYKV
jgi:hypothetical protein